MANEQSQAFLQQAAQALQGGQLNAAVELAEQSLTHDRENVDAWLVRGIALSQLHQPKPAADAFHEAIKIAPYSAKAHYNLAVHLHQLGQKQDALQSAKTAVECDTSHAGARELVQRIESELGLSGPTTEPQTPYGHAAAEAGASSETPNPPYAPGPQGSQPQPPYGSNPQPGSPYGQPPGGPPPSQQYGRYNEGFQGPVHSIPWIERMGSAWTTIGLVIVALGAIMFVFSLADTIAQFSDMAGGRLNPNRMQGFSTTDIVQAVLAFALFSFEVVWIIFDIADRRSNWLWLLPFFVGCCCLGVHWAVLGIYIWKGRP